MEVRPENAARGGCTTPPPSGSEPDSVQRHLDSESRSWCVRLRGPNPQRDQAIVELHDRLRREARFHIGWRARSAPRVPAGDLDDLATQAAGDALIAVIRKLDRYRGESTFWTWARRFAQLEAPVAIRRSLGRDRLWHDPDRALLVADSGHSPHERAEVRETLRTVTDAMTQHLTPRQRRVLIAVALDGVSPAALACELQTTPGAIYKTVHDARRKLVAQL